MTTEVLDSNSLGNLDQYKQVRLPPGDVNKYLCTRQQTKGPKGQGLA